MLLKHSHWWPWNRETGRGPAGYSNRSLSWCLITARPTWPWNNCREAPSDNDGELTSKAKDLRCSIAARDLRSAQPEGLRQDAVSYCLQALQLFEGMDQQRFIAVLSEMAAVGQGGLQINEPGTARSLKNLPGSWSDLALACLIHVGVKRLTPDQDSGLGIEAEYQEAVRLQGL